MDHFHFANNRTYTWMVWVFVVVSIAVQRRELYYCGFNGQIVQLQYLLVT